MQRSWVDRSAHKDLCAGRCIGLCHFDMHINCTSMDTCVFYAINSVGVNCNDIIIASWVDWLVPWWGHSESANLTVYLTEWKTMFGATHGRERGGKGKMAVNWTNTGNLQIFSQPFISWVTVHCQQPLIHSLLIFWCWSGSLPFFSSLHFPYLV